MESLELKSYNDKLRTQQMNLIVYQVQPERDFVNWKLDEAKESIHTKAGRGELQKEHKSQVECGKKSTLIHIHICIQVICI